MKLLKAYVRELIKILPIFGTVYLLLYTALLDGIALYFVWTALIVAITGPLVVVFNEREKT